MQVADAKGLDLLMSMYDLLTYNENYYKTSESLWQYCKDESRVNIEDLESLKSKFNFSSIGYTT